MNFDAVLHKVIWYTKFGLVCSCIAVLKYGQYLTMGGKILFTDASIQKPYDVMLQNADKFLKKIPFICSVSFRCAYSA